MQLNLLQRVVFLTSLLLICLLTARRAGQDSIDSAASSFQAYTDTPTPAGIWVDKVSFIYEHTDIFSFKVSFDINKWELQTRASDRLLFHKLIPGCTIKPDDLTDMRGEDVSSETKVLGKVGYSVYKMRHNSFRFIYYYTTYHWADYGTAFRVNDSDNCIQDAEIVMASLEALSSVHE